LTDLALSQADSQSIRLYAMSVAILERRDHYYRALESAQRGPLGKVLTSHLAQKHTILWKVRISHMAREHLLVTH
ncbi:hypothetical protein ACEUC9_21085, partial [Aeromonas caviae]